jgi:hypothetical protein
MESQIEVPDSGMLETVPEKLRLHYPELHNNRPKFLENVCEEENMSLHVVEFELTGSNGSGLFSFCGSTPYWWSEIFLIWSESRSEWIVVHHSVEGQTDFQTKDYDFSLSRDYSYNFESERDDRSYHDSKFEGPYALDDYCKRVLAKTYNIESEGLERDIIKINPSELKKRGTDLEKLSLL